MSGCRIEQAKKVIWNTIYPRYEKKSDLVDMEVLIPKSEIITFGKFNMKVFDHTLEKSKGLQNTES